MSAMWSQRLSQKGKAVCQMWLPGSQNSKVRVDKKKGNLNDLTIHATYLVIEIVYL